MAQLQDLVPGGQENVWGDILEANLVSLNTELIDTTAKANAAVTPEQLNAAIAEALAGVSSGSAAPTGAVNKYIILADSAGAYPAVTRPANTVFEFHGPVHPGTLMNVDGDSYVKTAS